MLPDGGFEHPHKYRFDVKYSCELILEKSLLFEFIYFHISSHSINALSIYTKYLNSKCKSFRIKLKEEENHRLSNS